jgi:hypothetical protein
MLNAEKVLTFAMRHQAFSIDRQALFLSSLLI